MLTGDMLRRSADRFPNKPAVICGDQTLLYKELEAKSNQLAHALLGLGLGQGAKVAILSRNLPEYAITFFGTARTGFVLNNLSGLYTAEELAYAAEKTDIEALIFDGEFSERVGELLTMTSRIKHVIGFGDTDGIDAIRFDSFISNQPVEAPKVEQHPDDPFCMTYTGGTTGRPKGVLCSHRARAATAMTSMIDQMIDERDIVAVVTPFYHIAALHLTFQPAIIAGATSVLLPKWSPEAFVEATAEHKVSVAFMVPTQATKLLSDPWFDAEKLKSWTKGNFAGAPMPDWVQLELMRQLPNLMITQNYGQSEMGLIIILRHWYLPAKLGSVGRQATNMDVRVVHPDGTPVKPGETGEIICRGDNLMTEYYGDPEQTADFFKLGDGWGWSGDLATIDEDGFITLVDRSKDMIISGGENLFPKEIEVALYELAEVGECAVFGIPDDTWGEVPAAFIILKDGALLDEERVQEHCRKRLAKFKHPRLVRFVSDFPKTPIGKIQKNLLREEFWVGRDKRI